MLHRVFLLLSCALFPLTLAAQFAPAAPRLKVPAEAPNFALLRQSWIEDLEAHRLLAAFAHYAPTAAFLNPDGSHAEGQAAIRDLYSFVFAHFDSDIRLTSRNTGQSGDLAYDSGAYAEHLTDHVSLHVRSVAGDYLTVYHRERPGVWLIVQQVWTEAPVTR